MIKPDQFDNISQPFDELYQELETFILQDISRRIKKAGEITSTAEYQLEAAKLLSMKNVETKIAEILKLSQDKVDKLFPQIANMSIEQENEIYKKAGLDTIQLKDSKTLQKYLSTAMETTKGDLENITRTLGFAEVQNGKVVYSDITKFYRNQLSLANMQISTGAIDYNTAIRQAVKKISESGVRQINYESGRSNEVYAAARRAVLSSTSQMSQQMTDYNMQKLVPNESDRYVEVSAHANARRGNGVGNHQAWQGRCYRVVGSEKDYPNLVESTGLGMAIGLLGIACRHSYMPFFPGISKRNYTEEELKNINTPDFEYEGKKYNGYEATQHQREIERNIRQLKRELICYKEIGLEEDFKITSSKLNAMNREYKKFSQASGIRPKNERTQQEGFGKSISKQATNAAKQRENEIEKQKELNNVVNTRQEAAATKEPKKQDINSMVTKFKELKVNEYTDREKLGRDILNTLEISKDVPVNIKEMGRTKGYCGFNTANGKFELKEYALKIDDDREKIYQIKTAFHEAFHAKSNGMESDFKLIEKEWIRIEETFAESSSHYIMHKLGFKEEISPAYSEHLVETLPRMKQLDKFKDCVHISDFGKIAWNDRLEGVGPVWAELYDECYKIKHNWGKYSIQYHDYISKNMDSLVSKMLENMPEYKTYKEQMLKECESAMKSLIDNNGSVLKLNYNEEMVFRNVLVIAMNRIGVK